MGNKQQGPPPGYNQGGYKGSPPGSPAGKGGYGGGYDSYGGSQKGGSPKGGSPKGGYKGGKKGGKGGKGGPEHAAMAEEVAPSGPVAVRAGGDIPRTSCWVDDVSYDLWKTSGGGIGATGRGVGERYENGEWFVHHPAIEEDGLVCTMGQQGIIDTYGHYGAMFSSSLRAGTAFAVKIKASELYSLSEGTYFVGLTPSQVFDPMQRPSANTWLPQLVATSKGKVSIRQEIRSYAPWNGLVTEVGFVVGCGQRAGSVVMSCYVNNELVLDSVECVLPYDTVHLFVFMNFVGDQAMLVPDWEPPPPGKGKGKGKGGDKGGKKGGSPKGSPKGGSPKGGYKGSKGNKGSKGGGGGYY